MATMTLGNRTSRMDLRMTEDQKRQLEAAADANGASLSQWALSRLMECARRELLEQHCLLLSESAFAEFTALLEEEDSPEAARLKSRRTRWDA